MRLTSMIRSGRSSLAITGFAALVLATGFSALSPRTPAAQQLGAAIPKLPMSAVFAEQDTPVQLAQMTGITPFPMQPLFTEEPQADARPSLLLDTPDEPAAVEQADTASLVRAALNDGARTTDAESLCLAETVYFEARGESLDGQLAVAQVVLNRVKDKRFANSICGVVHERSPGPSKACQFSFVCDANSDVPSPSHAWNVAQAIATVALKNQAPDASNGALFFHTVHVSPKWRNRMQYTRTVGTHLFYR